MDIIRLAITKPVTVAVGVILVVMFGLIGVGSIPIQLTPNVDRPEVSVTTEWPGRSPEEIVDEITKEQEEELKNVTGLKAMRSTSAQGLSQISLEFYLGTDISRALQEVSDSLRQVSDYPEDVEEPQIKAADGASENAIAWIIVDVDPAVAEQFPDFDISTLFYPIDKEIKPYLERVDGVAEVNVYGGRDREMRILVDTKRLALRGLSHLDLAGALRAENVNISAGSIEEGKRDYRVRVLGQFTSPEDILDTIIAYRDNGPVYVRDVADVEFGYEKKRGFVRSLGHPSIAINAIRQSGANVMQVMEDLRARLDEVRTSVLPNLHPEVGEHLRLRQVYDETIYITSAIDLVTQNLWVGGAIAALVLLLFLRSFIATGVIALAIPISVIGTFLILLALGRTLNVISLAGLAFAVGMVVDNAIVVLENIYRHRQMGKTAAQAAYDGGKEVWGAVLASTLTTVAVFVPVLTVQEEAGQLFRDISLAVVAAVMLSLAVSITVIPAACARFLPDGHRHKNRIVRAFESLFGLARVFAVIPWALAGAIRWMISGWRAWTVRPLVIVGMTAAALALVVVLRPPLDYLPAGNRNLVFGGLLIPPGYSVEQMTRIAERIEGELEPYVGVDPRDSDTLATLPPIMRPMGADPYDPVPVDNFFIGSFNGGMFVGATSAQPDVVLPVGTMLTNSMSSIPDAYGGARQTSLFGRGVGGGNTIDIEISGPRLDRVKAAAGALFFGLGTAEAYGFRNLRANPANFNLPQQEFQASLNRTGTELGLRTDDIGTGVRALFDGAFVGEYRSGSDTFDIRLLPKDGRLRFKEQLAEIPVATPRGPIVAMDTVLDVRQAIAPQEIRRIEELPSVTILVTPPEGLPLETVMADIEENFIAGLRAGGLIDRTMRVRLEGTAAKLDEVRTSLLGAGGPSAGSPTAGRRTLDVISFLILGAALIAAVFAVVRWARRRDGRLLYGACGFLLSGAVVGGLLLLLAANPQLMTARFVWALVVTYLLMCALFESFAYPFVIMFTVPLAIVGGFAGLAIVHATTAANPLIAVQNLDVLTMLGFVILVGVVVNNAILIVHQALNLMAGRADSRVARGHALPPIDAIAESVRTRTRPVFMSTLTSVGGMLPLILFPGAGSELYRGLGSVVVGGLLVATVFTLILVPLAFSVIVQMREGVALVTGRSEAQMPAPWPGGPTSGNGSPVSGPQRGAPVREPATADAPA